MYKFNIQSSVVGFSNKGIFNVINPETLGESDKVHVGLLLFDETGE